MSQQQCVLIFGNPGSGKTTLLERVVADANSIHLRQYRFLLPLALSGWEWQKRAEGIQALAAAIAPIEVHCSVPEARFSFIGDPITGSLITFGVRDWSVYEETLQYLADAAISVISEVNRQAQAGPLVIEFAVPGDMYEQVFKTSFEDLLKRLRHPASPYYGNTCIIQVDAPAQMRKSNLSKRRGNPIEDTLKHHGPPEEVLKRFRDGWIDPRELHQFVASMKLPTVLLLQHPTKGLDAYIEGCSQLGNILTSFVG
jgi:GTPase SAR1 family protein